MRAVISRIIIMQIVYNNKIEIRKHIKKVVTIKIHTIIQVNFLYHIKIEFLIIWKIPITFQYWKFYNLPIASTILNRQSLS